MVGVLFSLWYILWELILWLVGYKWADTSERQQLDDCIAYLKNHFSIPWDFVWFKACNSPQLLTSDVSGVTVEGTSDLAIVLKTAVTAAVPHVGIAVLIELKKDKLNTADVYQSCVELLAADFHSKFIPVVVLTNLQDSYQLLWFENGYIATASVNTVTAASVIQDHLQCLVASKSKKRSKPPPTCATKFVDSRKRKLESKEGKEGGKGKSQSKQDNRDSKKEEEDIDLVDYLDEMTQT